MPSKRDRVGIVLLLGFVAVLTASSPDAGPLARERGRLATEEPRRAVPMNYDPAAPSVPCDTACHSLSPYRREQTHQAPECIACHMRAEDIAREQASATQEHSAPGPAAETGRRSIEGTLVQDQKRARLRLKGRPMVVPATVPPAPAGMVYIPSGEFIMGSNIRWNDESPEHVISLPAYFIDRYEVSNAEYKRFVDATAHKPPDHWNGPAFPDALARHPVTFVSWHDAAAYCRWAGKRLPSEQEWEKAARGTDGRQYPWGDVFHETRSNNPQKGSKGTEPVGSYENGKSPYGLYDMSGNVWEWVDAWYKPHPGNTVPSEEFGEKYRASKGGSWFNCLFYNCGISAPSYNRAFLAAITRNSSLGFRCVKDVDAR